MKILKQNKYVSLVVISVICLAVCTALRTYELIALTEKRTGFMVRSTEPLVYVLLALIGLVTAFSALYCRVVNAEFNNKRLSLMHAVVSILLSVTLVWDYLTNGFPALYGIIAFLCTMLQVLSALYFLTYALSFVFFKPLPEKLSVIPLVFFVVKAATIFIQNSYRAVISDTVFDIAAYSFVMLFFLEYVRFLNGIGNKSNPKKVAVFGVLAMSFCITASLPKLFVRLFLSRSALHDSASFYVLLFVTGIYIAVFTFSGIKLTKKPSGIPAD